MINPERIEEYINAGGYQATKKALTSMTPEEVIEEMKISGSEEEAVPVSPHGLNGMRQGRMKPIRIYGVQCGRGDPGAFMDRSILEGDPHSLLKE